ncbi:MAG: hypothetical protein ACI9MR_002459, partial [Myxococcota bacterium]
MDTTTRTAIDAALEAVGCEDVFGAIRALTPAVAGLGTLPGEAQTAVLEALGKTLALTPGDRAELVAGRAASAPSDTGALYALGQALLARGRLSLAEGVLRHAVSVAPNDPRHTHELVAALELQGRSKDVVVVFKTASDPVLKDPTSIYLNAFHHAALGDFEPARAAASALSSHPNDAVAFLGARLVRILTRTDAGTDPALGDGETRLFRLSGTVTLATAAVASLGEVRAVLDGLVAALDSADAAFPTVLAMADRDSQVLAHAIAAMTGTSVTPWFSSKEPGLIVAWNLANALPEQVALLRERHPGQLLFAMGADDTEDAGVAPDFLGFLSADAPKPPWGGDGGVLDFSFDLEADETDDADEGDRPADVIAKDIASQTSIASTAERPSNKTVELALSGAGNHRR